MKIRIAFEDQEEKRAAIAVAALRRVLPGVKVKEGNPSAPVNIIYLQTGKSNNISGYKGNT